MEETKKISTYQLIFLVTISEIMHQYTYLPILSTTPNNQDSWIALIFFIPYIFILGLPILVLMNKFKGIAFYDMMTLILGKIGAKIGIFIICIFFCFCNIACLSLSIIFLKSYILADTPIMAIAISILIPVAYISLKGLKAMCRLSTLVFIMIVSIIITFFIFGFNQMDLIFLKPVMKDSSFLQINIGGFITAARISDVLILLVAAYRLKEPTKINKVYITSSILYIAITLLILIPVITVLGVGYGLQAINPYYVFARQVEFYNFLQRSEIFIMISWMAGAILKISIYHYLMAFYISKIFNVKSYKRLVIPVVSLSFLIIMLLGLDKSYIINTIRSDLVFPWIVLFFAVVVPLIVLIIYLFRRKKVNKYKELMLQ